MKKKRGKYGNKKTTVNGITFDSRKEAARYAALSLMVKHKIIFDLRVQVPFELVPTAIVGGRKRPSVKYKADFVYKDENGSTVVEDCKGFRTPVYKIKRHMMKAFLNIDILET